ncbi:hypothetical protein [Paracoccus litorisediminis]|uniref:Uncharacterized protein n=1 Tax=Paracoccus litorisediminis TaxID=2006130 RepID=A0A844HLQ8_9RHOB|nr:hypothetical protein [Paracoccus litorisediminis]MTH61213.1 hypothetical protein [Paracoccus litorisediminis]
MANYAPVRPKAGASAAIPSSTKRTMIVAEGGDLLLSSDAVMNRATAIPLRAGRATEMPANVTWICTPESGAGAEIRRMDIE